MPEYDLSQVECFLFEPETNVRRLMRDALTSLRMPKIQLFGHMEELRTALQAGSPDLLVADATGADTETFKLVHGLRHSQLGGNPFLAIIITAFNPTKTLLARVTNCGADALLVKPLSPKQIQERIHALIDAPRKFVVTSDFVGPDRRKSAREDSPIPLIDAPNTLRLKALNMTVRVNLNELINRAIVDVNEQKLLRHAFQAAFLIEFAIVIMPGQPTDRMALDHLQRVVPVLEDLTKRLPAGGTGNRATVASQATELIQAVEIARSQALSGMVPPGLDRLKEMALGIMKTLTPERSADAMGKEVADAAAAYLARLQALAEAKAAENVPSITAPLTGMPTTFTR